MEVIKVLALFLVIITVSCFGYEIRHQTGCASAGLCCEQVNNTCFVPNSRKIDGGIGNCFCDSKCLQMRDCCVDFDSTCNGRYHTFGKRR